MPIQGESVPTPLQAQSVRALVLEAWRRAEAMGLVGPESERVDAADVDRLVRRVREVGIARGSVLRFDNVDTPTAAETESLMRMMIAALEASPVASHEWPAVSRVLDPERLASLLSISISSLRRYLSGDRDTPDDVAARLHHLALTIGDLAGAYNDVGIRRWFDRKRTALGGRTPAELLASDWNPDDPDPKRVRALARSLVTLAAT